MGGSWQARVHPHLRGESVVGLLHRPRLLGSPPPAWGKRCRSAASATAAWFTPTCVGNSIPLYRSLERIRRSLLEVPGQSVHSSRLSMRVWLSTSATIFPLRVTLLNFHFSTTLVFPLWPPESERCLR